MKYAGKTIQRSMAADCSEFEKALIASHFVLVNDHYEHPDIDVPFACTHSKSNGRKGYFFAGYNIGEDLDDRIEGLKQAVKKTVGEGESHVANMEYVNKCLLVRYSLAFSDEDLTQEGEVLRVATEFNEKVKQVLGNELRGIGVGNIKADQVYSTLIEYLRRRG